MEVSIDSYRNIDKFQLEQNSIRFNEHYLDILDYIWYWPGQDRMKFIKCIVCLLLRIKFQINKTKIVKALHTVSLHTHCMEKERRMR